MNFDKQVSFTKVFIEEIFVHQTYRHLDIGVSQLKGLEFSRLIRFKLFRAGEKIGLEFRQLAGWPRIFDIWPGDARDDYGEVFRIIAGDPDGFSILSPLARRKVADICSSLIGIVTAATTGLDDAQAYVADAREFSDAASAFVSEQWALDAQAKAAAPEAAPGLSLPPAPRARETHNRPSAMAFRRAGERERSLPVPPSQQGSRTKIIVNALGYVGQSGGAGGAGVFLRYLVGALAERAEVDVLVGPGNQNFADLRCGARFIEMPYLTDEALRQLVSGPTVVLDPFGALPCDPFPEDLALCGVIHDLMHLERPNFFTESEREGRSWSFARGVARADSVIAFSEDQARAIRKFYPGVTPIVIPHLPYAALQDEMQPEEEPGVEAPFLLFPAVKWPHKNHRTVISAFDAYVRETGSNLKLVLCGGPCAESRFSFFPDMNGLSENIIDLGRVRDGQLQALFNRAEAILFPTLYEGFGIPVLEAAYSGKTVVATRLAVFDEILGSDGYYAIDNSLCHLRWMRAFQAAEDGTLARRASRLRALRDRVDPNAFADKFFNVLSSAAARYRDPSSYPVRKFRQGDRLSSAVVTPLTFADIYDGSVAEKGLRYPAVGEASAPQSSTVFISQNRPESRTCLRATYDISQTPPGRLQFYAWARLRDHEGLTSLNWSVNDGWLVDLLPMLAGESWHLIRLAVPPTGFIDLRGVRGALSEATGFELELHNPCLVSVQDVPSPHPDRVNEGLRIVLDGVSASDGTDLTDVLAAIERLEAQVVGSRSAIQWTVLMRSCDLDLERLANPPAHVCVLALEENHCSRVDAVGLISPYEPMQRLLLLSAADLEECLEPENLEILGAASGLGGWVGRNRLALRPDPSSLWSAQERGVVLDVSARIGMPLPVLDPLAIQECLEEETVEAKPRFAVIETDRVGGISHHSVVTDLFLSGAEACGFTPCLGLNRGAGREGAGSADSWYGFSSQVYEPGSADTFAEELSAFVDAVRLGPADIVFMHSLSPQIVLGTARYVAAHADRSPRFLFRFFSTAEAMAGHKLSYVKILKSILATRSISSRMHFFCESENLITYYAQNTGAEFPLLLNPEHPALRRVRLSHWHDPALEGSKRPVLAYFGEARAEKGFDYVPSIVEALLRNPDMAEFGFLIQTGSNSQNQTPDMARAKEQLTALKAAYPDRIRLFQSAETPEEFYFLMKHTVGVISPYRPTSYGKRGTGVTLEAIQMGLDVFCFEETDLYATFKRTGRAIGVRKGEEFADVVARFYANGVRSGETTAEAQSVSASPEQVCRRMLAACSAGAPTSAPVLWIGNDTFGEGCSAVYSSQKTALAALGRDCFELFVPWPDRNWVGVNANGYDAIVYGLNSRYESKGLAWVARPKFGPGLSKVLDELESQGPTFARLNEISRHFRIPATLQAAVAAQGVTQTLLNYVHHFPVIEGWMPVEGIVCETHDVVSYQHAVRRKSPVSLTEKIDEFTAMAKLPKLIAISISEQREIAGACSASDVYWRLPPYVPEPIADADEEPMVLPKGLVIDDVVRAVLAARPETKDDKALARIFDGLKAIDVIDMVLVGSAHPSNVASFEWFLREVFTPYLEPLGYNVVIAGSVCSTLEAWSSRNIVLLGRCRRIEPLLAAARTCPLPVTFGSGSPIKTIPAMAVNGAVTVTEHIDSAFGLSAYGVPAVSDPKAFADDVLALLSDDAVRERRLAASRAYVERELSGQGYVEFWGEVLGA